MLLAQLFWTLLTSMHQQGRLRPQQLLVQQGTDVYSAPQCQAVKYFQHLTAPQPGYLHPILRPRPTCCGKRGARVGKTSVTSSVQKLLLSTGAMCTLPRACCGAGWWGLYGPKPETQTCLLLRESGS